MFDLYSQIKTISVNDFCNYLQTLPDSQNITSITLQFYGGSISINSLDLADGISPTNIINDNLNYNDTITIYNELITKQNSTLIPFFNTDVKSLIDNETFSTQKLNVKINSDDTDYFYDRIYFVYNNHETPVATYYLSLKIGKFLVTGYNKSEKLFRVRFYAIYTDLDRLQADLQKCFPNKQITLTSSDNINFEYSIKQKSSNISKQDSTNKISSIDTVYDIFNQYNVSIGDLYDLINNFCLDFNYFVKNEIKSNNDNIIDVDTETYVTFDNKTYDFETPVSIFFEYVAYLNSSSYKNRDGYKTDDINEGYETVLEHIPFWKAAIIMSDAINNNDWPDNINNITKNDLINFLNLYF